MTHKAYICGKISGENPTECFEKFQKVENTIRVQEMIPVNPIKINGYYTLQDFLQRGEVSWVECMKRDIKELLDCDFIVVLPDWRRSNGARLEVIISKFLGIKIVYLNKTQSKWQQKPEKKNFKSKMRNFKRRYFS